MRTIAFAVLAAFFVVASPRSQDPKLADLTPEQALDELRSKRDDADLSLPEQASKAGSEAAARGLASLYDQIRTIAMRRAFVRALSLLAEQQAAAAVACEKLANIAANTPEDEVRDPAVVSRGSDLEMLYVGSNGARDALGTATRVAPTDYAP